MKRIGDALLRSWAQYPVLFLASAFLFWYLVIEGNQPTGLHILFIGCLILIFLIEVVYRVMKYVEKRRASRRFRRKSSS